MKKIKKLFGPVYRNIAWLIFEKLITLSLVFYSEGLITRTLSVEQYGQWIYALNLVTLISSVALISGAEITIPALSRNKKVISEIITSAFVIRALFAIVAYALINIYSYFFISDPFLRKTTYIVSIIIILNEPFSIIINYYQSIVNIKSIALVRMLSLLGRVVFVIYWVKSLSSDMIAWSRVIEFILLTYFLIFLWYKKSFIFRIDLQVLNRIFFRGLYFWPSLILMYIYLRLDRFYVEKYFSFEVLAIYGIAIQLMEQGFMLIRMILQSIAPIYIYKKLPRTEIIRNLVYLMLGLVTMSIIIALLGQILLPKVVIFIFGESYSEATLLTVKMLPALIFFCVDNVLMQYLFRERTSKLLFVKWAGGVVILTIIYYLFFDVLHSKNLYLVYNINYFLMALITFFLFMRKIRSV
ncbi:oligosaccharide flippase family protein [Salmonella enterica subsp. houtenae serovar 44:z36,[z38]:-]|nr:oligosaccharide flippase family protein [Salmonella enterica subsp. houtenae serovar 44:z36,[z38]:-]